MGKEKIIENIIIFFLIMLAAILLWFKFYVSTPHYFTYTNETQGYSFLIPADWTDDFEVIESGNIGQVDFMFKSFKNESKLLFSIKKASISDWNNLEQDKLVRPVNRELARVGDQVYYAQWLANNPYQKEEARNYLNMVRDFSIIFDSFTLSEVSKPTTPEFCIQVITPAINSITGEIKEFPTPCDVPSGWEIVRP